MNLSDSVHVSYVRGHPDLRERGNHEEEQVH